MGFYRSDALPVAQLAQIWRAQAIPRDKCLRIRASASIICPQRSIQPQPKSDVGPVPPSQDKTHTNTRVADVKSTSKLLTQLV